MHGKGKHLQMAAVCMIALFWPAGCRKKSSPAQVTIAGRTWTVELAATVEQRYLGLSGRDSLAEDAGMLFIYPGPRVLQFCMRGCAVPLDVAFIDSDLRVVKIHTMAVEPDRAGRVTYSSETPVQYALEVAGGVLAGAGVSVGDEVRFSSGVPEAAKAHDGP